MAGTEGNEEVALGALATAGKSCSSIDAVLYVADFARTDVASGFAVGGVSPLTSEFLGSILTFSPFAARLWYLCQA